MASYLGGWPFIYFCKGQGLCRGRNLRKGGDTYFWIRKKE